MCLYVFTFFFSRKHILYFVLMSLLFVLFKTFLVVLFVFSMKNKLFLRFYLKWKINSVAVAVPVADAVAVAVNVAAAKF